MKTAKKTQRGVSLPEILAAVIALAVIAMAVQSLLLLANQFLARQNVNFKSLQDTNFMDNLVCLRFSSPPFVQMNPSRSFYYSSSTSEYEKIDPTFTSRPKATFAFPLLDKSKDGETFPSSHTAAKNFINGDFTQNSGMVLLEDDNRGSNALRTSGHEYKSKFYKVHADSHTLIHFTAGVEHSPHTHIGHLKDDPSNFIVATRCIENKEGNPAALNRFIDNKYLKGKGSVIDTTDPQMPTQEDHTASALYILEGLKVRPFYFPKAQKHADKIKCCNVDINSKITASGCGSLREWTPITYLIKIASQGGHCGGSPCGSLIDTPAARDSFLTNTDPAYTQAINSVTDSDEKQRIFKAYTVNQYYPELLKHFAIPITFLKTAELPLIKTNQSSQWASSFIAPSLKNQDNSIQLTLLNVANGCSRLQSMSKCHFFARKNLAQLQMPGSTPGSKLTMDQMLQVEPRSCPFQYVQMSSTGGPVYMGLQTIN